MVEQVLNYEERGEGSPIVLVHGFPFDYTIWEAQLKEVSKSARVLAPDLPGFGGSAPLAGGATSMDDYAIVVAQWARDLGLDRFVLVGHSMGGYIAFAFARRFPEMLSGLGLVATRPGPDTEQARQARFKQIDDVWNRGPIAVVEAMLPRLFSPETQEKKQEIVDQVRGIMERQTTGGIVTALRAMADRIDSTPTLANLPAPTLVVSGADDAIIPAPEADLMASMIPGAAQEAIQGAGHMLMLERPDKLNPLLAELARSSRSGPAVPPPPQAT